MPDNSHFHSASPQTACLHPAYSHWWERLWRHGELQAPAPRPVWTPEARLLRQELPRPALTHNGLYPLPTFYERLTTAIAHAKQQAQSVAVLILQLPDTLHLSEQSQREMEIALRLSLRSEDVPAHLTATTLAILLPGAGSGAAQVGARLEALLKQYVGEPVHWDAASYPQDGETALELLRRAARQSLRLMPGIARIAALERLLGSLGPHD
jgi:hypothetical protein